ncbi:MAG: CxxC-x17-CxxC domain-containing protein [Patescibacteria group bacterium]
MRKTTPHQKSNTIFKTVCDVCHKPCEVPFKPNGKKPVLCDACFAQTRDTPSNAYARQKDKTVFETPENFVAAPYTGGNSMSTAQSTEVKIAELKRELSSANAKLDKLIDMFSKFKQQK